MNRTCDNTNTYLTVAPPNLQRSVKNVTLRDRNGLTMDHKTGYDWNSRPPCGGVD